MSTKIYNAFTTDVVPAEAITKFVHNAKPNVIVARNNVIKKYYDRKEYQEEWSGIWERAYKVEKTRVRDPLVDFSMEMTFYPQSDRLLFTVICEHQEMIEALVKFFNARDYHYQNQTDGPKEVDEEEWKERRDTWDKVFAGKHQSPAKAGLTIVIFDYDPPTASEVFDDQSVQATD